MADEHKVYINSESYYFGHKRLPTDLPLETTGTGSLESPRTPVQGGSVDGLTDAGALTGAEEVPLAGAKKTTTQDIADLGGGGSGYLVYTALMSQQGTDAPTVIIIENTLGAAVVWTRNEVGDYVATLTGVFTVNKTFYFIQNTVGAGVDLVLFHQDVNTIFLGTNSSGNPADEKLFKTPIEIRVYP